MVRELPTRNFLSVMAQTAFDLGYNRGLFVKSPETAEQVKEMILSKYPHSSQNIDWRKLHWIKMRACYGAGFDLSRLHQKIKQDG